MFCLQWVMEQQVAIIEGEVDVSSAFAETPWDHLVFTGSTAVGKIVMGAAAKIDPRHAGTGRQMSTGHYCSRRQHRRG